MTDSQLQQKRLVAAAIDFGILVGFGIATGLISVAASCSGALADHSMLAAYLAPALTLLFSSLSLLYVLGRDVLAGDRSIGKKTMGVRVVTLSGAPAGMTESVKRNALFAPSFALSVLAATVQMIPFLGCLTCLLIPLQILAVLFGIMAVIWEIVQITSKPDGERMGDQMAGTRVVF